MGVTLGQWMGVVVVFAIGAMVAMFGGVLAVGDGNGKFANACLCALGVAIMAAVVLAVVMRDV
jgi:hypothetical protein